MINNISQSLKISLLLLATMGVMSGIAIVASLPLISKEFSHIPNIDFYSKLLLTIPSIIIAIFAPFAGLLIDKVGRLKPLYIAIIMFIVGGSSGFYLDDFYLILLGRGLLGLSVAIIGTVILTLVSDLFSQTEQKKFLSLKGMTVGLSGIFFIIIGGYLATLGWQYPFLLYLLPLLFLPLWMKTLNEPKRHKQETAEINVSNIKLWYVYLTAFFSMSLFYTLPTQMPYLIINELHSEPQRVSYIIAFAMLVNALTSMNYHKIKEHFSFSQIFMLSCFLFSIGFFIISQVTESYQLFFSSSFIGAGFGLVLVNINVWLLSKLQNHKKGHAIGVLTSSMFLGQFFSPIFAEIFVGTIGIQGLFLVLSGVAFCVATTLLLFQKLR